MSAPRSRPSSCLGARGLGGWTGKRVLTEQGREGSPSDGVDAATDELPTGFVTEVVLEGGHGSCPPAAILPEGQAIAKHFGVWVLFLRSSDWLAVPRFIGARRPDKSGHYKPHHHRKIVDSGRPGSLR